MRSRFAVLASVLAALVVVPVAGSSAAPHHIRSVTINVTPNPVTAGDGVFIYGQLNGPAAAGRVIRLYQRVNPSRRFTLVARTKTNSVGFYSYRVRSVGSNRSWFVRGPGGVRSRNIREGAYALLSLMANPTSTDTKHPVVFSGHVSPNHTGERVYLQQQKTSAVGSDDWHTIKTGVIGAGSNYSITYRWRVPDSRDVRVLFRGDARNIRSASDSVTVTVQQSQGPGFTITTSDPVVPEGNGATISGVLDKGATGNVPDPGVSVTLWARTADEPHFVPLASTTTGSDGSYSFAVHPTVNTNYLVRTTFAPRRQSAVLFEGVRDVVTMAASSPTAHVGDRVTFSGTVGPDKTGSIIYLQRLGKDGDWHNVEVTNVRFGSTFQFTWRFGDAGIEQFRARIVHDEHNIGGVSPPVKVTVT